MEGANLPRLTGVICHTPPRFHKSGSTSWTAARGCLRITDPKDARLWRACRQVLDLFESHGLPVLVLNAVAFHDQLYPGMGRRPSGDFDLLVPFARADEALTLLREDGWEAIDGWENPVERLQNAVALRKGPAELDLHWFLLREARHNRFDEPFWRDRVVFELDGHRGYTLFPTHHLLHLLVAANREAESRPRYLLDLHWLTRRFAEQLDQGEVAHMLQERHLLSRLDGMPLSQLGLHGLATAARPSRLDRWWSEATRYVFDGSHEWQYLTYPFLDYYLHFRGQPSPGWGFWQFLRRRLEIRSLSDLMARSWHKVRRMLGR